MNFLKTPRAVRQTGLCLVLYVALGVASFYPQSLRPHDTIGYVGDSLYCVFMIAWTGETIVTDPLHFYDGNILYPNPRSIAFGDHQLLPSILAAPVYWLTKNPVLAYNWVILLACLLAAFAARHLARRLGVDDIGAWAAGALYAFHTFQINEAPRVQLIFHGFIPLALGELIALLKTGSTKHMWRLALFMLLQGLSSNYHLLYACLLVGLVTSAFLLSKPRATARAIPKLAVAAAIAAILYFPVVLPYLLNAAEFEYSRELPAGIDLVHYVSTTPTNLWYGPIGTEVRLQQRGPHFIGFIALAGAGLALALWAFAQRKEPEASALLPAGLWIPASAIAAVLVIAFSLGRDMVAFGVPLGPGPYRLLYEYVPGFQLIRVPERFGFMAMLFIALLVGWALTQLGRWNYKRAAIVLAALVPLEHLSPLVTTDRIPVLNNVPAVYTWLRSQKAGALAEVPVHGDGLIRKETLEMYFSTRHDKPIIHGYTSFPPLVTTVLRRLAAQFPEDVSLHGLLTAGIDTVVVHRGRPHGATIEERIPGQIEAGWIERLARFAGEAAQVYEGTVDEVYGLVSAPPITAAPMPRGRRLADPSWNYRTKAGGPLPAVDGDITTAWEVRRPLAGDEFFEVTFDEPVRVSGLVLRLRQDSKFPTRFKVGARRPEDGQWVPLAFYDAAHEIQLLERLLADPNDLVLGFDWSDREVTGIILMLDDGGESHLGWSIPEIEVWVPEEE